MPVLVTIAGEAGIGKSRLADELLAGLDERVTFMMARTRSHAETATFAPIAAVVADLAGIEDGDTADKTRQRLDELAARYAGAHDADRLVDRLGLLFRISERRDESAFVHDVHAGFLSLMDGLAAEQPVVIVVEDAHTLSGAMLDLIERLGLAAARRRPTLAHARAHAHRAVGRASVVGLERDQRGAPADGPALEWTRRSSSPGRREAA